MVIYEIEAKVRDDLIESYENYMRKKHIQDLLDTKYFEKAEITLVKAGVFRMSYLVKDRETLDNYLETDAEALREDFIQKFPEGVEVSRQILEVLETWQQNL